MPVTAFMARKTPGVQWLRFGDSALKTRLHPLVRTHPETGRKALFVSPGYTIGIDGRDAIEAGDLLRSVPAPTRRGTRPRRRVAT